jgi:hypothetical protein
LTFPEFPDNSPRYQSPRGRRRFRFGWATAFLMILKRA